MKLVKHLCILIWNLVEFQGQVYIIMVQYDYTVINVTHDFCFIS